MLSLKENRIVQKMLDRLFAALVNGPSLNARPHSSRQRIDLTQLGKLKDQPLEDVFKTLLDEARECKVVARVPAPAKRSRKPMTGNKEEPVEEPSEEEKEAQRVFSDQQSVLTKCRGISEDARTYENDTGVHVLQIGFPLLSIPPGSFGAKGLTRRILAPICLISVSMTVKGGATPGILLECRNEGADLVVPNVSLLAWLESQAGRDIGDLDGDEHGAKPWDEIAQIVSRVCGLVHLSVPEAFMSGEAAESKLALCACPKADDLESSARILSSAIVGLFPLSNQGLIRDTQAMLAGESVEGPIESFVNLGTALTETTPAVNHEPAQIAKRRRDPADERLIASADPCQSRAVKLARESRGLVVHGPPGTGKSQTIANIIGDHLTREQRVLFVCDKRTALDVVMNRLDSMGLGSLCAIVHDPQRDQRDLHKAIREQLDNLAELRVNGGAAKQIERLDGELQRLHDELASYHTALMEDQPEGARSFHKLMGDWLELPAPDVAFKDSLLAGVGLEQIEQNAQSLHELFERGGAYSYPRNPWNAAVGMTLPNFLASPMDEIRNRLHEVIESAKTVDSSRDAAIPAFGEGDVIEAAKARGAIVRELTGLASHPDLLSTWAKADSVVVKRHADAINGLAGQIQLIEQGPLDRELIAAVRAALPSVVAMNQQIVTLDNYIRAASGFFGFLAFGKKKAAGQVLAPFGLQPSIDSARRVRDFVSALKARVLAQEILEQLEQPVPDHGLLKDDELLRTIKVHAAVFALLSKLDSSGDLKGLREPLAAAAGTPAALTAFVAGLDRSLQRAESIARFEKATHQCALFNSEWSAKSQQQVRRGEAIHEQLIAMKDQLTSMENVLRVREGLARLQNGLREAVAHLLDERVSSEDGLTVLRKAAINLEIASRLRSDSRLQAADAHRLQSTFARYLTLEDQKKATVREAIVNLWGSRQKSALLAMTGSRLNSAGADLRRRFVLRGERAMRLRQVITVGQALPDGDPLFDLRPVWMASPETAAQIFPRKGLFDVVVFDEASQCRLEEALPVLLRGKRVVIAGDPKQLPPTRFFESAVTVSEDEEIESDQQLFESQQGEIEDLLAAALNIEIEECYLDVHYRSRNSDLIEFSNGHFYGARLQPIPGHPANRTRYAPLTLYRANGVYKDRQNEAEAQRVCLIVRDLLRRAEPPSIGIACFNISQRDLILEKLDDLAESDSGFARSLAEAKTRRGRGQFEGLFVKNLENVQGDERDHIIISTTYGPDTSGRFYRRFGPLGRAGGGRRLNVLVTRARDEVHLVTSIPESEYRGLPPIPAGQTAGGPWLLFSYLAYAERLSELYEEQHQKLSEAQARHEPTMNVRQTKYPSEFCVNLGRQLLENSRIGSDVYWGNDGFCVDLAMQHPKRIEDVTIGIVCDTTRFEQAADPVEWEVFRTIVLESQGWKLHRLWTPHFFRDPRGSVDSVRKEIEAFLAQETAKDAIRVSEEDSAAGPDS